MNSRQQNIFSAVAFLGISAFVYYQTYTRFVTRQAVGGGPFANSAFFPRVVAGAMVVLSVILLIKNLVPSSGEQKETVDQGITPLSLEALRQSGQEIEKPSSARLLSIAGLLLLYTVALPWLGYLLATPLFMATLLLLLWVRRPFTVILLSAGSVAAIHLLFSQLLNVILPRGRIW